MISEDVGLASDASPKMRAPGAMRVHGRACRVVPDHRKNCDPFVFGPPLAMATTPRGVGLGAVGLVGELVAGSALAPAGRDHRTAG